MTPPPLELAWFDEPMTVCRLDADAALPEWARVDEPPVHVSRTRDELSIALPTARVPDGVRREGPFAMVRVVGTLDFALVGILARLTSALAHAGVSVFAISTFDTDYLLVPSADRVRAEHVLLNATRRASE